ncbi:hypothetical protein FHS29_001147 [Saccharothrix tamanrassetensis]|uniref:Uncharacterized protein n=1 Tax=Saccharothrix tamanrassetensis TaxID=1051531 RepID=A0A841CEJ7_9PSEU|nr:hypothetical protein [Saccharothrix tamanrassetensis]MBB5954577.1 hypothetical protein [Saccharothrix tamanrassetensis]
MTDIKQTLETAFDDEPPLTIDTATIVRAARREVGVRRSATAIAALATVAAVCVPAMLGSSGGGGAQVASAQVASPPSGTVATLPPSGADPAAPTTAPLPPGATSAPGTDEPPGAYVEPKPPKPVDAAHAAELTGLLAKAGVPEDFPAEGVPGNPMGAWEFVVSQGEYKAVGLLLDPPGQVVLTLSGRPFGCRAAKAQHTTCELRRFRDTEVAVVDFKYEQGHALTVHARTSDGGLVSVTAVNSDHRGDHTGPTAPLTYEQLAKIATLPGLSF